MQQTNGVMVSRLTSLLSPVITFEQNRRIQMLRFVVGYCKNTGFLHRPETKGMVTLTKTVHPVSMTYTFNTDNQYLRML